MIDHISLLIVFSFSPIEVRVSLIALKEGGIKKSGYRIEERDGWFGV